MEKVIKGGSLENTVDEIAKEIIKRDKTVSDESIAAVGALQEEVSSVKSAINSLEEVSGFNMTVANLLHTILSEAVYGSDQTANIELLYKATTNIAPISISAVLSDDVIPYVYTPYSDLVFIVTATFDDYSTMVVPSYTVDDGVVVSGQNTATVRFRGITTTTTFQADPTPVYQVSYSLDNVISTNKTRSVIQGDRYATELLPESEHYLDSCTVVMGGIDVTEDVYVNGVVSIETATGDIVITAVAQEYHYIDPLIETTGGNWGTVYFYSDNGQTQVGRANYNNHLLVSEYPAKADCIVNFKLKNITEDTLSIGIPYIGSVPGMLSTSANNYANGNIWYSIGIENLTHELAPGESIEGTVAIKKDCQIGFAIDGQILDDIELSLYGDFVPNTFDDFTEYRMDSTLPRYGGYRNITWIDKDGNTIRSGNYWKSLISNSIEAGEYESVIKATTLNNTVACGMVDSDTSNTAYGAVGMPYAYTPNIWYSTGTLSVTQQYPNLITDEGSLRILKIRKVVSE